MEALSTKTKIAMVASLAALLLVAAFGTTGYVEPNPSGEYSLSAGVYPSTQKPGTDAVNKAQLEALTARIEALEAKLASK